MRLTIVTVAVLLVGLTCGQSNNDCLLADRAQITFVYCQRLHECRSDFALTDEEFLARYGSDIAACKSLPLPFVDAVMENAEFEGNEVGNGHDPELQSCFSGLASVSCEDIASDALLAPGRACDPEVIGGTRAANETFQCEDEVGCT